MQKRPIILRSVLLVATPYLLHIASHYFLSSAHCNTIFATISRLHNIIGLFCKRALQKRRYSAKETYNVETPTHHSHTISCAHAFVMAIFCAAFIILHTHMYIHLYIQDISGSSVHYGVATISLLLKTTSRFCRISSLL